MTSACLHVGCDVPESLPSPPGTERKPSGKGTGTVRVDVVSYNAMVGEVFCRVEFLSGQTHTKEKEEEKFIPFSPSLKQCFVQLSSFPISPSLIG